MSRFENKIGDIANCQHAMALRLGAAERCPHCGAIRLLDGSWALPHLVDALVRAWKEKTARNRRHRTNARCDSRELLQQFVPGQRVRAVETIVCGSGEEVVAGTVGYVQRTHVYGCTPLVTIAWNGHGGSDQPPHICSVESLEDANLEDAR